MSIDRYKTITSGFAIPEENPGIPQLSETLSRCQFSKHTRVNARTQTHLFHSDSTRTLTQSQHKTITWQRGYPLAKSSSEQHPPYFYPIFPTVKCGFSFAPSVMNRHFNNTVTLLGQLGKQLGFELKTVG